MRITPYDLEQARHAKAMIEKDLSRHYTYHDLAKTLGMNVSKLQRSFKLVTGRNLYEYLTHIRIKKAMELLETTELTIDMIAYKVGLVRCNLIIHFKKVTGKCPGKWRNEQDNNDDLLLGQVG